MRRCGRQDRAAVGRPRAPELSITLTCVTAISTRSSRTTLREMQPIRIPESDEAAARGLIARGEPGGVERKAAIPKGDGLCTSVAASRTRMVAGSCLVSMTPGAIVGWRPPGRAQIHDHLREQLRGVDPMPAFTAELVARSTDRVGVLHAPESAIKPHGVRERGVVLRARARRQPPDRLPGQPPGARDHARRGRRQPPSIS